MCVEHIKSMPPLLSSVEIVGRNVQRTSTMLNVLSYFLRGVENVKEVESLLFSIVHVFLFFVYVM